MLFQKRRKDAQTEGKSAREREKERNARPGWGEEGCPGSEAADAPPITSSDDKMASVNALWKLVLGPQDINLNSKMIYPNSTTINAP